MKRKAFTLIEILVATTILAMVLVMVSATFGMSTKWQTQTKNNQLIVQSARLAMETISRDIRYAKEVKATYSSGIRGNDSTFKITKQDDSIVNYRVDFNSQKLFRENQEMLDSNKVLVTNTNTSEGRFASSPRANLYRIKLILAPKSNPSATTTFITLVTRKGNQP